MEQIKDEGYRSYQGGFFKTLISPAQTGNAMALIEFTLPKGAEPPPHIHQDEDETFYVLEGELSVRISDTVTTLKAGDAVFAPRNEPHAFTILSGTIKMLNLVTPGTLWNYFYEFSNAMAVPLNVSQQEIAPDKEEISRMLQTIESIYHIKLVQTK